MNELDLLEIGKRIQNCRKQRGMTQEQLADKMNVSVQMVSNLERGVKAIKIDNLLNLSKILDVSTDYILTGKETIDDHLSLVHCIESLSERDKSAVEALIAHYLKEA